MKAPVRVLPGDGMATLALVGAVRALLEAKVWARPLVRNSTGRLGHFNRVTSAQLVHTAPWLLVPGYAPMRGIGCSGSATARSLS